MNYIPNTNQDTPEEVEFRRRLILARRLLRMPPSPKRRELSAAEKTAERDAEAADNMNNPLAQIFRIVNGCPLPGDGRPPRYQAAAVPDDSLAAALKSVLSGKLIAREVFLTLYRRGFVVKEQKKEWQLTPIGRAFLRSERTQLVNSTSAAC